MGESSKFSAAWASDYEIHRVDLTGHLVHHRYRGQNRNEIFPLGVHHAFV